MSVFVGQHGMMEPNNKDIGWGLSGLSLARVCIMFCTQSPAPAVEFRMHGAIAAHDIVWHECVMCRPRVPPFSSAAPLRHRPSRAGPLEHDCSFEQSSCRVLHLLQPNGRALRLLCTRKAGCPPAQQGLLKTLVGLSKRVRGRWNSGAQQARPDRSDGGW